MRLPLTAAELDDMSNQWSLKEQSSQQTMIYTFFINQIKRKGDNDKVQVLQQSLEDEKCPVSEIQNCQAK